VDVELYLPWHAVTDDLSKLAVEEKSWDLPDAIIFPLESKVCNVNGELIIWVVFGLISPLFSVNLIIVPASTLSLNAFLMLMILLLP
jgi:hypothetical protein